MWSLHVILVVGWASFHNKKHACLVTSLVSNLDHGTGLDLEMVPWFCTVAVQLLRDGFNAENRFHSVLQSVTV